MQKQMINCSKVSKNIGNTSVLEDVSFRASKGELVGILGPNGAGKTTTMRILSTFLLPSSGVVEVGGYSVIEEPDKVRSMIGVLPESPPLYDELSVYQYLSFFGELRNFSGKKLHEMIMETISKCRLDDHTEISCGALSKGFRQKVGLAAAIIGDPDVLLLDEPTSGLDPREITEIRSLIKDLKLNKTILLSSHILSEVSELCDRVVIFVKGRTVVDEDINSLTNEHSLEEVFLRSLSE